MKVTRDGADTVDWDTLHRRLEQAQATIQDVLAPGEEKQWQILRERASALAHAAEAHHRAVPVGEVLEVLEFSLAGELYAFETGYVLQVAPLDSITPIPGVPDFVVGVTALQGDVISVLDLRSLLNLPLGRLSDPDSVIVIANGAMELGVLAETIHGIRQYAVTNIEHDFPNLTEMPENYLRGITFNRTAILNANQLLSDPRLVVDVS